MLCEHEFVDRVGICGRFFDPSCTFVVAASLGLGWERVQCSVPMTDSAAATNVPAVASLTAVSISGDR